MCEIRLVELGVVVEEIVEMFLVFLRGSSEGLRVNIETIELTRVRIEVPKEKNCSVEGIKGLSLIHI